MGPGDCLSKTQHYANSKEDVYGVTRDQCCKVKARGQSGASRMKL